MDKPVFLARSMTKILDLSATSEVAGAIETAGYRGITSTDNDFATAATQVGGVMKMASDCHPRDGGGPWGSPHRTPMGTG